MTTAPEVALKDPVGACQPGPCLCGRHCRSADAADALLKLSDLSVRAQLAPNGSHDV